jgi:hypothetical protein
MNPGVVKGRGILAAATVMCVAVSGAAFAQPVFTNVTS